MTHGTLFGHLYQSFSGHYGSLLLPEISCFEFRSGITNAYRNDTEICAMELFIYSLTHDKLYLVILPVRTACVASSIPNKQRKKQHDIVKISSRHEKSRMIIEDNYKIMYMYKLLSTHNSQSVVHSINSLAPGKFEWNFTHVIFNRFQWVMVEACLVESTDDQSTLVQVMAWCRQATSHYLR